MDYWKEEEKKDKEFEEEFNREMQDLDLPDQELLHCDKKCIHNIGNICIINNWSCSN